MNNQNRGDDGKLEKKMWNKKWKKEQLLRSYLVGEFNDFTFLTALYTNILNTAAEHDDKNVKEMRRKIRKKENDTENPNKLDNRKKNDGNKIELGFL